MTIGNRISLLVTLLVLSVFGTAAFADSPKNLSSPDRHSVEVTGKVSLYRVQIEGMNIGEGNNKADAEVFISLDTTPKMVYTLRLKSNSPVANKVMAETLRDAYINKVPVTLYHQVGIKQGNNLKILMVQFN
jgi:hypothetical protein